MNKLIRNILFPVRTEAADPKVDHVSPRDIVRHFVVHVGLEWIDREEGEVAHTALVSAGFQPLLSADAPVSRVGSVPVNAYHVSASGSFTADDVLDRALDVLWDSVGPDIYRYEAFVSQTVDWASGSFAG